LSGVNDGDVGGGLLFDAQRCAAAARQQPYQQYDRTNVKDHLPSPVFVRPDYTAKYDEND
jgi:hypothetical protein